MKSVSKLSLSYIGKLLFLFLLGGIVYVGIELLWRGRSHWSMFIVGGLCFVSIGEINEIFPWDMPLLCQMVISSFIVTGMELFSGIILNIFLRWGVWDYSMLPYNFLGQICLLFSVLWALLSIVGIVIDDILRWKLFGEEKPHYHIFYCPCEETCEYKKVFNDKKDK